MQNVLTKTKNDIKILEGFFSTSEAIEVMNKLLDVKINHHKLQILTMRIQNEDATAEFHESRIEELNEEKKRLNQQIRQAGKEGRQVQMNGSIQISFL